MKNPLSRRLLRELRQDIGKYIALFLFLTLTTGFISGFLVADGSMVKAYDESFEKYDIESGHFILEDKLPDETRAKLEAAGVSVHELFYKEATLDNENTVRIFQNRSEVNKTDVLEGRLPESEGEIAADRLYLENNGLTIGDELAGLKITGAVALSDYSALFKNNTDMMLDANKFCVAVVTPETFDEIDENVHLCYAWLNNDKTLSDEQCRDKSDELGEILAADCGISDIVERSENQAISFTGEDMGSDKAMMTTLLYVVTENESAEPFCLASLEYDDEEISVYGIKADSKYAGFSYLPASSENILVSEGFLEKYGLSAGDKITLHEKYGEREYTFNVFGTADYAAGLAVFMDKTSFNENFDLDLRFFNGYFSNERLTDLDPEAVSTVITEHDLTVIADQLNDSMGFMFPLMCGFSLALYMLLVYLLSKMIIEKNAQSISMLKILGYTPREISSLYNSATAIAVGVSLIVTIPFSALIMKWLFYYYMHEMSGWVSFYIAPWIWPAMLGLGAAAYFIVHLIQTKRLGKIPLAQALKNME